MTHRLLLRHGEVPPTAVMWPSPTAGWRLRLGDVPGDDAEAVASRIGHLGTAREAVVAEVRRVLVVLGQGRAAPLSSRKS